MSFISARIHQHSLHSLLHSVVLAFIVIAVAGPVLKAQSPNPAATGPSSATSGGFVPGWTLGTRFEGSASSDGSVYDIGTAIGRNFTHHFAADVGVPVYFIGTPTSVKQSNTGAVSGVGLGSVFVDLRMNYPSETLLNYASAVHLTAPTGDTKKGLSTGHATWNFTNHLDHAFGDLSPFVNATVGNTVLDTHYFHRPYTTFGYNAAFEGGLEYDPGKFSFSASAYDVAPWGAQTLISRVFRCGSSTHCSAGGPTNNRESYLNSSVSTGAADLVRDNGFNAGIDFKPTSRLDLEFDYSRSVPLQLNVFSFGIGVDLSSIFHNGSH